MLNVIRVLLRRPVKLSEKQQARLDVRLAKAQTMIAEQDAKGRAAMEAAAAYLPPGTSTDPADYRSAPDVKGLFKQSLEGFRDAVGEMFDDRRDVLDPGPGADFARPPAELEDADERAQVTTGELAARVAARRAYLAAEPPQVVVTRVPTTGRRQLEDIVSALQATGLAAAPERVFGVSRVPERFDMVMRSAEASAYVEWEIVHAPGALPACTEDVAISAFRRDSRWITRRPDEPSVLDEDLPGLLCARAGLAPEDCLGVPRLVHLRGVDSENGRSWHAHVDGVAVLSRPAAGVAEVHAALMAQAPLALDADPTLPFHVEVLDWEAIAAWNHTSRERDGRIPAPLPHLPGTPQELLEAYLHVVGVGSADTFQAGLTRRTEGLLADLTIAGARFRMSGPPKRPCADGKDRVRRWAGQDVVVVYRDTPAYAEGRARWAAYQSEVLRARLDHRTNVRPPLVVDLRPRQSFVSEVFDMFNPLDPLPGFPQLFGRGRKPDLGDYCGTWDPEGSG